MKMSFMMKIIEFNGPIVVRCYFNWTRIIVDSAYSPVSYFLSIYRAMTLNEFSLFYLLAKKIFQMKNLDNLLPI